MFDLKMNLRSNDLVISPNNDLAGAGGTDLLHQRIHIRLLLAKGSWLLDPTNGGLGSGLPGMLRAGQDVVLAEAELTVREALSTLDEIEVLEVRVVPSDIDSRKIQVTVVFTPTRGAGLFQPNAAQSVTVFLPPTTL